MARFLRGPDDQLVVALEAAAEDHAGGDLRIAVAWARDAGAWLLLRALDGRMQTIDVVVGVNEAGTSAQALLRLLASGCRIRTFFKYPSQTFHPKVYRFMGGARGDDENRLIVGSSNLTRGGLLTNFEASLELDFNARDSDSVDLAQRLEDDWETLCGSPFCREVEDEGHVAWLVSKGYVATEQALRRRRRRPQKKEPADQPVSAAGDGLPTAPPEHTPTPGYTAFPLPLEISQNEEVGGPVPDDDQDPEGQPPLVDRFFVRTLTENDADKLVGQQVGTFEPDLGETARDRFPAFWGWPDKYQTVTRQVPREEWSAKGRLVSTAAPQGVDVEVMLWYRADRPGHAAEHRIRLGPIPVVRDATPPDFDASSLMVVELAPPGSGYDFNVRFLTAADPEYGAFASYLSEVRPAHRFGYGP